MDERSSPRSMVKALLRGERPPRPLLLPTIFSLGARLQNVPLREFHSNPTKITNALRQILGALKVDGLSCSSGPFLEAEALGCKRERRDDGSFLLKRPAASVELAPPEKLAGQAPITTTCEVLRRLKVMLKDGPALTVHVAGPYRLAAQVFGSVASREVVESCAQITAFAAKTFVDAGADVVFLTETGLPELSAEECEQWLALVAPAINVIRFYEALPVLVLDRASSVNQVLASDLDGVVSLPPDVFAAATSHNPNRLLGVNVSFAANEDISADRCVMLTSEDVPISMDFKPLADQLGRWRAGQHGR